MTVREEVQPGQLAELLKQVQSGNEVVLTQNQKPVAKIIATNVACDEGRGPLRIKSLEDHKVLTPNFTHAEIADEMFGQK
jgi:antitoxin (DNA-binding transcriptional repressor) of toxin-antitoxin stability system